MIRRVVYWVVFVWVALGTLLMLYTSAMALRDPKLHLGMGPFQLMGARALMLSVPLTACGIAGLFLLVKQRLTGAYLVAVLSTTWTICLGVETWKDFDGVVAGMAAAYLLAAIWSLSTARNWARAFRDNSRTPIAGGTEQDL